MRCPPSRMCSRLSGLWTLLRRLPPPAYRCSLRTTDELDNLNRSEGAPYASSSPAGRARR
jgi:hypothetical protein